MSESARILILDDDANLCKTLGDILRVKGFDPVCLETGGDALERVQTGEFAVALIDLRLEDMPGLEVLRGIRQHSPATECILVTGHASQATAIEAINAGAYSYVQKPFDVDQLAITIQRALEKSQAGRVLRDSEVRFRGLFEDSPISIWVEDFSEVKRHIEELRQRGVSDFRAYFKDHPEVVYELVRSIKILDVNKATLKLMHAASREELTGSLDKITGKQVYSGFLDEFLHIAGGETDFEWEGLNYTLEKKAMTVNLHWSVSPGFEETLGRVIVSLIDITERKRVEEALYLSEERFRSVFENVSIGIYHAAPDGRFLMANPAFCQMLGYDSLEELVKGSLEQNGVEPEYSRSQIHELVESQGQLDGLETSWKMKGGKIIYVRESVRAYRDLDGKLLYYEGTAEDISQRKQAEEALRQSEERFRSVFENVSIGIYRTTPDGRILLANPAICEMLGYDSFEDLAKRNLEEDNDSIVYSRHQFRELIERNGRVVGLEAIWKKKDGNRIYVRESARAIQDEKGNVLYYEGTAEDVTIHKQAENLLAEQTEELRRQNEELTRLNERAERRMQRLVSMRTIDMAISGSFDVNIVLGIVLDQLTGQLGIHAADILLFNPSGQIFKFASGRGFRTQGLERSQYKFGSDLAWRLIRERRKVEIQDLKAQPETLQRTPDLAGEGFVAYIGVPLMSKGQIQGVLEVFQREPLNWDQEGHNYLDSLAGQAAIAIDNSQLFDHLQGSNTELVMAYDSTLAGWASALELRDKETEGHTRRVASLTTQLAQAMGLSEDEQVQIYRGALLHDIGKMGVPDSIVLKPGPLTEDEWATMRKHPQYAFDMLAPIGYLRPALDIPHCHHEKWDGTGYPRGLKGENIPLAARIFAVMDVWDALTSDRPYRKAWSEQETIDYIRQQSGIHFDPAVVKNVLESSILKKQAG